MTSVVDDSGTFTLGSHDPLTIRRLGFGAMRIVGPGVWGEPPDRATAIAVMRRAVELGVDFIDTADAYGPYISEDLIREALHPYDGVVIATKGGLTRQGPDIWAPVGRPEYLRQCVLMSLRRLGVDRIDVWQLHRIDPLVPAGEQFDAIRQMQQEGLIRHVGLSEISVEDLVQAQEVLEIVSVQNLYSVGHRGSEAMLQHCVRHDIGFIPWFPLGNRAVLSEDTPVARIAHQMGCTPAQVALAWLLQHSPVMLPIPGTGSITHVEENCLAARVHLSDQDMADLENWRQS